MKAFYTLLTAIFLLAPQLNAQGSDETPTGRFEPNVINVTAFVGDTVETYFDLINTGTVRFYATNSFWSDYGFFTVDLTNLHDYIYPGESRRAPVTFCATQPGTFKAQFMTNIGGKFPYVSMTGTAILRGDVNQDGRVDISDVVKLIEYILNEVEVIFAADINSDGSITISDLVMLINYLLNDEWVEITPPNVFEDEVFVVNGVSFKLVAVKGGTFTMGDGGYYTDPAHEVTVSDFHIAQTEVTQALWQAVMGNNPSGHTGNLNYPVENVSWNDCQQFIATLNQLTGRNFRLPTEAEWEFAAGGGNLSHGYQYSGSNNINDVGWSEDNSGDRTQVVASKNSNELGLFDMSGNVWEWCQDWFAAYPTTHQTDPVGPDTGDERIVRGGCMRGHTRFCDIHYRMYYEPSFKRDEIGLRLAL